MNGGTIRGALSFTAFALCAAACLVLGSCRFPQKSASVVPEPPVLAADTGVSIEAHFARPDDEAPGFFTEALPDSGIAVVRVTLRNDGAGPLVIHSTNGIDLGPGFSGVTLAADGAEYAPLHPRRILELLVAPKDAADFRKTTGGKAVAGILIPPLGIYYVYEEATVGKYYRPLFKHSLYPALESGMFAPIRLEPGAERSGFLYFALPADRRDVPCELRVRACVPIGTEHVLPGRSFSFSRDEVLFDGTVQPEKRDRGETGSCDAPYGYFFSLGGTGTKGAKSTHDLFFHRMAQFAPNVDSLRILVASIDAKSAAIADVSCRGSLTACAVNFRSKSKVFLMRCGGGFQVFEVQPFSRRVDRVFVHSGGALVVTADGYCHRFDGASHRWAGGVKLGTDLCDVALLRGYLVAFARREVIPFETSNLYPLARRDGSSLRQGDRRVIGLVGENLALLNRGSKAAPDTIAIFDIERKAEIRRGVLPGVVAQASTIGSDILAQLKDGTLLRIEPGPLGTFKIAESGYLPFEARALRAAPHGFIAIGVGGEFAVGEVGHFRPGIKGAVELSAVVR